MISRIVTDNRAIERSLVNQSTSLSQVENWINDIDGETRHRTRRSKGGREILLLIQSRVYASRLWRGIGIGGLGKAEIGTRMGVAFGDCVMSQTLDQIAVLTQTR